MKKYVPIALTVAMMAITPCTHASLVTIFLDNGSNAPGSSNSGSPFVNGNRDVTWDISASAENGLVDIGAAVMSVRLVCNNMLAASRGTDTGGGNGLAVQTGSNNAWFDGGTGEAAIFQFAFYSDAGKTSKLAGLNLTLNSLISRVATTDLLLHANAASGELTYTGPLDNNALVYLNGTAMTSANDASLAQIRDLNLKSDADAGVNQWFTIGASGDMTFSDSDTFWLRRANANSASDGFYQLGGVTLDVIPEPVTLGLIGFVSAGMLFIRRFMLI